MKSPTTPRSSDATDLATLRDSSDKTGWPRISLPRSMACTGAEAVALQRQVPPCSAAPAYRCSPGKRLIKELTDTFCFGHLHAVTGERAIRPNPNVNQEKKGPRKLIKSRSKL